jgi:hypothetical protein
MVIGLLKSLREKISQTSYYNFIIRISNTHKFSQRTVEFGIDIDFDEFPIYCQFGFPVNDPAELITDCVMFLTEYTPVVYSIGVFIEDEFFT